jgi:hypothetical protein
VLPGSKLPCRLARVRRARRSPWYLRLTQAVPRHLDHNEAHRPGPPRLDESVPMPPLLLT